MKRITTALLIFITLSCGSEEQTQIAQNKTLVEEYFEYFNNKDWEKMSSLYSENAEFFDPAVGNEKFKQSRAITTEKYQELGSMFPDLKDEVINIYPSGSNHVIVEFISKGTAPDGTAFELPICTVFMIQDGKIIEDFSYYDNF